MRLQSPHIAPAGDPVTFTFDGRTIAGLRGETIAAALTASGQAAFRRVVGGSNVDRWRGLYCGMGVCFDCALTIDGRISQRACMVRLSGGEEVRSSPPSNQSDEPLAALVTKPNGPAKEIQTDILVIGAGPAGLGAALEARRRGAEVIVLDERSELGGQYFKPLSSSLRVTGPLDRQFRAGQNFGRRVEDAGVKVFREAQVFGAFAPDEILALVDSRAVVFRPRRLVLATGAFERAVPIPGWTLPGVMTSGAGQTLARSYRVAPGNRIVIAGNGPLNLQLAAELSAGGATIVALVDSSSPVSLGKLPDLCAAAVNAPDLLLDGARFLSRVLKAKIPVLWGHTIVAAEGNVRVERVRLARLNADGSIQHDKVSTIEVDSVCLGYGFAASTEIARALGCIVQLDKRHFGSLAVKRSESGETSVDGVFVAGDGAEVAGARVAMASGAVAGAAAAGQIGFGDGRAPAQVYRARSRALRFQKALWRIYAAPPANLLATDDATVLCRCEHVTFGQVRAEIGAGWDSLGTIKRRTRLGMGRCQGRYCSAAAGRLIAETTGRDCDTLIAFAPRLPAKPFPAAALAIEKPEWGGHGRAESPDLSRSTMEPSFANQTAEIAVIGGGVVGACLAYYLAKEGRDVLVLERDDINLQASGANAGSLHVQLLSFDFGAKAEAGGGPAAQTLPLGPWSVRLWQDLARASPDDFEIRITGGLMVADTESGMRFLEAKSALERRYGIETEMLDRAALRTFAPALSGRLLGAEYAAQEGKINPLAATYAVFRAATVAGARYLRSTNVTAIERQQSGWLLTTSRGRVFASKVVNAAGPWAQKIGAMAGLRVPVFSAPLQMIVTEPAPPLVSQLVAHADRHLSLKQASTGGLIIGGAWAARYDPSQRLNVNLRKSIEGNLWVAADVLPQLSGLHVLRCWAGMNVNIDGAPIVGEAPGAPGFFNAVTSNGYTLAPAIARLTTDLIVEGEASMDIGAYRLDRFGRET